MDKNDSFWLLRHLPVPRHGGGMPFSRGVINPWRVIGDHELFIFTDGEARMTLEGTAHPCPEGSWLIIPPASRHLSECLSSTVFVRWMHFTWGQAPPVAKVVHLSGPEAPVPVFAFEKTPGPGGMLRGSLSDLRLIDLHDQSASHLRSGDARRTRLARAQFLEELLLLIDLPAVSGIGGKESLALKVKARLDEAMRQPARDQEGIQKILSGLGHSYAHLERRFRAQFQLHPARYLAEGRMRRARELLEETSMSVAAVARELGYDDPAYFSRLFRKITGRSPARVRER
jgi:AraC-like DNA-binding protein